jgi:hypothetical protein
MRLIIFVSNLQVFKDPSGKSGTALEDYGMCGGQADFRADLGRNGALSPLCYAQLSYRSARNFFRRGGGGGSKFGMLNERLFLKVVKVVTVLVNDTFGLTENLKKLNCKRF